MRTVYNERDFDGEHISCGRCGWEGRGDDAVIIDFYGLTKIKEVHCPNCDTHLANLTRTSYSPQERSERWHGGDPLGNQIG